MRQKDNKKYKIWPIGQKGEVKMEKYSTKFSCSLEELKNALRKAGFKNSEIESDEDVVCAISSLIAAGNLHDIEPFEEKCHMSSSYMTSDGTDKVFIVVRLGLFLDGLDHRGEGEEYAKSIKELQKMIFGDKT